MSGQPSTKHRLKTAIKNALPFITILALATLYTYAYPSYYTSSTGFIVKGNLTLEIYDGANATQLTEIEWGNVEVSQPKRVYAWLHSAYLNIIWWHNASDYIQLEVVVELAKNSWSLWRYNSTITMPSEWLHIYFQLTALPGASPGEFLFYIYFSD